jgi:hypothetical protein
VGQLALAEELCLDWREFGQIEGRAGSLKERSVFDVRGSKGGGVSVSARSSINDHKYATRVTEECMSTRREPARAEGLQTLSGG